MRRNKFSLSHYKLLTMNMGELIPVSCFEVLPGDTIRHQTSMLIRLSPLLAPLMHPVRVRLNHFYVPFRLIFDDWEDWITGGEDGLNSNTLPYRLSGSITEGTLADYLGIPIAASYSPNLQYSALPFRAYAAIYNEFFRDQQLVTALTIDTTDGQDTTTNTSIQKVSWEKDYFSTLRTSEQLGTEVTIPLLGDAPITGLGKSDQSYASSTTNVYETDGSGTTQYANSSVTASLHTEEDPSNSGYPNIRADLSAASGVSINDLRLNIALQRYKENRNEDGARYIEYLLNAFGVRSSDARLNNPEYLGGGRQTITFSEVLSTADSGTDVVGTMRGHGVAAMRSNRYIRFFEEHGLVMSLLSVVPKAIYSDGLPRFWSKTTKEEFYQRELAHIGDMAVPNSEIYAMHSSDRTATFGYAQRYDDYRSMPSSISGEFQSSLNHWHFARVFGADPSLNQSFIECSPTKRQYADNSSDVLYVMANHSIQARRVLPKYPTKRIM